MNKPGQAARDVHISDDVDSSPTARGGVHPLSRVLVTLLYILSVVSFSGDAPAGLAGMVIYPLAHIVWYEISVGTMCKRIWPVLLLTGAVGIANPVLDREVRVTVGGLAVTSGMISMLTLMIKGIFCVAASYILAVTTGMRQICYALRLLHIPEEIVTVIMLMHRYLMVFIKEVERMQQAYRLRAPGQRGLRFRTWGSFVGLLLLRSMDRAEEVYESMKLRGFQGRMPYFFRKSNTVESILYVALWGICFFVLRMFPVFQIVGNFFR